MVTELFITFATAFEQRDLWKTADMAQLVEQRIRNAWVAGSSPAIGSLSTGVRIFNVLTPLFFSEKRRCGFSSVGRALVSQAEGRGFESRNPLF